MIAAMTQLPLGGLNSYRYPFVIPPKELRTLFSR